MRFARNVKYINTQRACNPLAEQNNTNSKTFESILKVSVKRIRYLIYGAMQNYATTNSKVIQTSVPKRKSFCSKQH